MKERAYDLLQKKRKEFLNGTHYPITRKMKRKNILLIALLLVICLPLCGQTGNSSIQLQKEAKPWTYWWWMGSSVTADGITESLENMRTAGIGGVHIIPIYGQKGDEKNYLNYLSPGWMKMLKHTADEAARLGMGVDMTTGTGWPFGGPDVTADDAAKAFFIRSVAIKDSVNINECLKKKEEGTLLLLAAYDAKGNYQDLTAKVSKDGMVYLDKVSSTSKLYAVFDRPTRQKVKRAAPGGEGLVMDHFNSQSTLNYMKRFEEAFNVAGIAKGKVRSFYNDSFEVYGANWTSSFFTEFTKRRGYDLRPYIAYLADTTSGDLRQRVITDYCETISDLLHDEFAVNWIHKSHELGFITRYQAHGSPGNLLDLYALSDIPETESFGASGFAIPGLRQDADYQESSFGRPNPLAIKFASSAANIAGRPLVSAESTTWLGDHFKVSLSQIKPQIDELFVSGINHVFFHGSTYSPKEIPFPGRLFYASTNYNPNSHFWNELPALTGYIARCQSILQGTQANNDLLLYFPIHEVWKNQKTSGFIRMFDVHKSKEWLQNTACGDLAQRFWNNGYTFDYISDHLLESLKYENGHLVSGQSHYKAIVVPSTVKIPLKTLSLLKDLSDKGALILFEKDIPSDVPGLGDLQKQQASVSKLRNELLKTSNVIVTPQVLESLAEKGILGEEQAGKGLRFIRKQSGDSIIYFIANLSDKFSQDWVNLNTNAKAIEIYDPVNEKRGAGSLRKSKNGTEIYLQLSPGQSCILTCTPQKKEKSSWEYVQADEKQRYEIKGPWSLRPTKGGPVVPPAVTLKNLQSWTNLGGAYETFSGKAVYSCTFKVPKELLSSKGSILDLGTVRETARVKVNGKDLGLVWCLPYRLTIPKGVIRKENTLEIEVTNLSFNRVIQLDRDHAEWKNFHEVNFVNIRYQPYDASDKRPEDSGLTAPIYLMPVIH